MPACDKGERLLQSIEVIAMRKEGLKGVQAACNHQCAFGMYVCQVNWKKVCAMLQQDHQHDDHVTIFGPTSVVIVL